MVIPEFMWLLNRFIEEYGIVKFEAIYRACISGVTSLIVTS